MASPTDSTMPDAASLQERYLRLYAGAIGDILDKRGYRNQILPYWVTPMTQVHRLAGPAFTGQGYPAPQPTNDDTNMRLAMLESITPGCVSVWACGGSTESAHWGELMSTAAMQRGCVGAVMDGGVRDLEFIDELQFPVFARFKCAASSIGRWDIKEFQVPIRIGDTHIRPGDFIFGDADGVVVVPAELTVAVLEQAEDIYRREGAMRRELRSGVSITDAYAKYGSL